MKKKPEKPDGLLSYFNRANHQTRLFIATLIREDRPMTASEIVQKTRMSRGTVARLLKSSSLVLKKGKTRKLYRLKPEIRNILYLPGKGGLRKSNKP
jgi:hypothetical protein